MAEVKNYGLTGLNSNVELGKQGSYISGSNAAVSFYDKDDALQNIVIANATTSTQAVTKSQLDAVTSDLVQHVTVSFDYNSGSSNIANVSSGTRILGVTVDINSPWGGTSNNQSTYIEVGDDGNASRYIRAKDVDVLTAGQYHSQYQYEYSADGVLSVNVTQGSANSGSGTISILLSTGVITVTDYGTLGDATSNTDLGNIS